MCMHAHNHTRKQTLHLGTFRMLTFTVVAAELCEASPWHRLTAGLPGACRVRGGGRVLSVVARAHVSITFHQRWPQSPSLMCLNQSGMWTSTLHASDIMEFPLLRPSHLRDSSFDISHRWLARRGSPPTTPPDHRWTLESLGLCGGRSSDSPKVKSPTVHVE